MKNVISLNDSSQNTASAVWELDGDVYKMTTYKGNGPALYKVIDKENPIAPHGHKFYFCENIIYQPINQHYSIEIYNDDIYCNLVSIDDNKLTYDIIDDYRLARNLLVKTICNNVEKDYLYSLGTQSICLDELLDGDYVTTEVYLVYDVNKTNQYIELFTANGNSERGNWIIKTHYIDEDTKTLSIELSDGMIDNLDNIKVNGIVKYEGSRVDIKAIIVSSIIVLVVFFSISYGIISLIRKYKYNFKY